MERDHLLPDWSGARERLDRSGLSLEAGYTGDYMVNVHGGVARKGEYLGNLDLTLTWHTEELLGRDFGSFFLYGLVNHGGRPSDNVGDTQAVDNIEAPDAAKLFEAWWQKTLFEDRASILLGLYDVNSEFALAPTGELFLHSSFGMSAALGTSGINGPSTFPVTSLGARVKVEPFEGFEVQAAVVDGVPGDPDRPHGTRIELDHGDGVFVIAEVARHWPRRHLGDRVDVTRVGRPRRVGREWAEPEDTLRIAVGAWVYSTRIPHLSKTNSTGQPVKRRGHPGMYLVADFDASRLDWKHGRGLSAFLQLGFADGDVAQFGGYAGGGVKYRGAIPFRPADEVGFAVAAAFNGHAYKRSSRTLGQAPADSELAFEWTYRAYVTPWLAIQGDVQYVMNPAGLRSRPDAVVTGFRFAVDL